MPPIKKSFVLYMYKKPRGKFTCKWLKHTLWFGRELYQP